MKLYQELSLLLTHLNQHTYNSFYQVQHARLNELLIKYFGPVASAIEVVVRLELCRPNKIVLSVNYNHEGDVAGDGIIEPEYWTSHQVAIIPSFINDINFSISGNVKVHPRIEALLREQLTIETGMSKEQQMTVFGKLYF